VINWFPSDSSQHDLWIGEQTCNLTAASSAADYHRWCNAGKFTSS
jgi:hypothetical protein